MEELINSDGQVRGNNKPYPSWSLRGVADQAISYITFLVLIGGLLGLFNYMSDFATKADVKELKDQIAAIETESKETTKVVFYGKGTFDALVKRVDVVENLMTEVNHSRYKQRLDGKD